jgi:hypothetical protein
MIKLKDILLESSAPNLLIPRRIEGRVEKYVQSVIQKYIKDGSTGGLDLSKLKLTKLPDKLKNVSVGRNFDCSLNNLTSLVGAPNSVGGYFDCHSNDLTSLDGAPSSVGLGFDCSFNKLTSLDGVPSSVGGHFDCRGNRLTSLAGAPRSVVGEFYCRGNAIKFTIEQVRAVCDVKGTIFV